MDEHEIDGVERAHCVTNAHQEPLVKALMRIIRLAVRILAILMVLVVLWGIVDVLWVLYQRLKTPPHFLLNISDILATFGAFLAVLIAIEIFENIILYLRKDIIHVRLVIATALMAVARKVIIFDYKELSFHYVWASGTVILALGITYWLISRRRSN